MRHGNKLFHPQFLFPHIIYSDPTYEAWKLEAVGFKTVAPEAYSDPTYEAWKLFDVEGGFVDDPRFRSYL